MKLFRGKFAGIIENANDQIRLSALRALNVWEKVRRLQMSSVPLAPRRLRVASATTVVVGKFC